MLRGRLRRAPGPLPAIGGCGDGRRSLRGPGRQSGGPTNAPSPEASPEWVRGLGRPRRAPPWPGDREAPAAHEPWSAEGAADAASCLAAYPRALRGETLGAEGLPPTRAEARPTPEFDLPLREGKKTGGGPCSRRGPRRWRVPRAGGRDRGEPGRWCG